MPFPDYKAFYKGDLWVAQNFNFEFEDKDATIVIDRLANVNIKLDDTKIQYQDFHIEIKGERVMTVNFIGEDELVIEISTNLGHFTILETEKDRKENVSSIDFQIWLWSQNHNIAQFMERARKLSQAKEVGVDMVKEAVIQDPKIILKPLSTIIKIVDSDLKQYKNAVPGREYYALLDDGNELVNFNSFFLEFDDVIKYFKKPSGPVDDIDIVDIQKVVFMVQQPPVLPTPFVATKRPRTNSLFGGRFS